MSKGRTAVCAHIQSLCSERAALPENGIFENGLFSDSQQVVPLKNDVCAAFVSGMIRRSFGRSVSNQKKLIQYFM